MLKKPKWKMRDGYNFRKEFKVSRRIMPRRHEIPKEHYETSNEDCCEKLRYLDAEKDLVINAVSAEPFSVPISTVLTGWRLDDFTEWLVFLSRINRRKIHLVIDSAAGEIISQIDKETYGSINIYSVPAIYPRDHPIIAAKTVFGGHIKSLNEANAEITRLEDMLRVYSLSRDCQHTNWSMLSLNFWDNCTKKWQQEIYDIYGDKFSDLLTQSQSKKPEWLPKPNLSNSCIIAGGLLTGRELKNFDEKVTPDMSPIIIMPEGKTRDFLPSFQKRVQSHLGYVTTNLYGEERPCVNCGWCDNVCPIEICVENVYQSIEYKRFQEAERLGLFECLECGLCAYICPSKIEILEKIKSGKEYKQEGVDNV